MRWSHPAAGHYQRGAVVIPARAPDWKGCATAGKHNTRQRNITAHRETCAYFSGHIHHAEENYRVHCVCVCISTQLFWKREIIKPMDLSNVGDSMACGIIQQVTWGCLPLLAVLTSSSPSGKAGGMKFSCVPREASSQLPRRGDTALGRS